MPQTDMERSSNELRSMFKLRKKQSAESEEN